MSTKPSFLLISRSGLWSGAEKMLLALTRALSELNDGSTIHCIFSAEVALRLLPAEKPNIEAVIKRPLKKVSTNPWLLFIYFIFGFLFLFKLVRLPSKCVIIFNDLESLLLCWPGALLRKSYFYLHDSHKLQGVKGRGICLIISLLVGKILVITRSRVKKLASIGIINTQYFPNCVLTEVEVSNGEEEFEIASMRGRYKAVSVGQITSWKRVDKSIVLINKLNKAGFPIDLEIYGRADPLSTNDAEYFHKIQAMCFESGFSKLVGYTEDLKSIYREADMFISMSVNEPFGLALVEALSYGVPAVAIEGEGPDEILSPEVGVLLPETFDCDDDLVARIKTVVLMSPTKCKERADLYSYEIYRERVKCEFKTEYPI